jgi:hypothetical protein
MVGTIQFRILYSLLLPMNVGQNIKMYKNIILPVTLRRVNLRPLH